MDTLAKINYIVEQQAHQESKTPQYKYEIYIVGDDKIVTTAALQLNKRIGAHAFHHVACVNKVNVLRFESPIPKVPVRDTLKRLNIKTRKLPPSYVMAPEVDLRDSAEAQSDEGSGPEAQAEGPSKDAESSVLGDSSVLDSTGENVQNTEASPELQEPQNSQA